MGRLIMGYWDCPYCEKVHIAGSERECPACGHTRGENTKFYMDGVNYVPEEEAETISRNPDWLCSFCGSLNNDTLASCESCGASKTDSDINYFEMHNSVKIQEEEFPLSGVIQHYEEYTQESQDEYEEPKKQKKKFRIPSEIIIALCTILGVVGLGFLVWKLVTPKIETLTVTDMSWERSISIEEERTVKESGWSVPNGGRIYDEKEELHHYDKVLDHYETITEVKTREVISHYETVTETKSRQVISHYETVVTGYRDFGNGYFEEVTSSQPVYETEYYTESHQEPVYTTETYTETRQEPVYKDVPVYKTKYYYEIEKWFDCRSVDTTGTDKDAYWGEVILDSHERENGRSESYYIGTINKKGENNTYRMEYDQWCTINIGDIVKAKIYITGKIELLFEKIEE